MPEVVVGVKHVHLQALRMATVVLVAVVIRSQFIQVDWELLVKVTMVETTVPMVMVVVVVLALLVFRVLVV
jgi:hypothetical protein